ncbi:MAG: sulfur carrier protein ThiS [Thioalkalivibrio sp.]|nr:sulfur carrier protein ThiS [Thioalkalivibrio sp.]
MQIQVNGEPYALEAPDGDVTLGHLVSALDLGERRLAIEVNEELVPRSEHASFRLSPGDRVEIVQAIGGG